MGENLHANPDLTETSSDKAQAASAHKIPHNGGVHKCASAINGVSYETYDRCIHECTATSGASHEA
jgi:hypothetical protein